MSGAKMEDLPVPYLRIDARHRILDLSEPARALFPPERSLAELLDAGSRAKAERLIAPAYAGRAVELNMKTVGARATLFEVYQRWSADGDGHLVCMPRQAELDAVAARMEGVQEELAQALAPAAVRTIAVPGPGGREAARALESIRELAAMLRPALVELDKSTYADLIVQAADEALARLRRPRRRDDTGR